MICEQCATLASCPSSQMGAYARQCWLAFGHGGAEPECEFFRERYWRESPQEWARFRRSCGYGSQ